MASAVQAPPLATATGKAQPLPGSLTEAEQELVQRLRAKYSAGGGRAGVGERAASLGRRRRCRDWRSRRQPGADGWAATCVSLAPPTLALQAPVPSPPSQAAALQLLHVLPMPQTAAACASPAAAPEQPWRAMTTGAWSAAAPTAGATGCGGRQVLAQQAWEVHRQLSMPQLARHYAAATTAAAGAQARAAGAAQWPAGLPGWLPMSVSWRSSSPAWWAAQMIRRCS